MYGTVFPCFVFFYFNTHNSNEGQALSKQYATMQWFHYGMLESDHLSLIPSHSRIRIYCTHMSRIRNTTPHPTMLVFRGLTPYQCLTVQVGTWMPPASLSS
jgi:hypothetical protein